MPITDNGYLPALKSAYDSGRLSFYLGAGVSKASGLPGWEELVQALYFTTLNDESYIEELKAYPNYLFAIAEWVLKQQNEPLDITIRKIKQWYNGGDFIRMIADTLYAGLGRKPNYSPQVYPEEILAKNQTLAAIIRCCEKSAPGVIGLRSIVTYNYDNLVELGLSVRPELNDKFQTIYKRDQSALPNRIPVYHVHGYIPYDDTNVNYDEIIFSEEQYNQAFQDPFFWGNMIQVNHSELDLIGSKAEEYLTRFSGGAMKSPSKEPYQIQSILKRINQFESGEFQRGFENLGLKTIVFDEYAEISQFLNSISG